MANPQKPSFSWGDAGNSGTSLFGKPSTTSQAPSGGLFRSTTNPPASSSGGGLFGSTPATSAPGGGLFGSTPATGASGTGLFGSAAPTSQAPSAFGGSSGGDSSSIFGGANKPATNNVFGQPSGSNAPGTGLFGSTPASSQPSGTNAPGTGLFGSTPALSQPPAGGGFFGSTAAPAKSPAGGGLFGSTPATSQPANTATSSAPLSFGTPGKPSETNNNQSQTPSVLEGGNNNAGGSSLFNWNSTSASSTTPTSKPTTSLFGNSTTPAGPPPSTGMGAPSSDAFNLFGKPSTSSSTGPSLFGNASSSDNPSSTAPPTSAAPTSVFDTSSKGKNDLFSDKANTQGSSSLFHNLGKPQEKSADPKANPFQKGGSTTTSASAAPATTATTSAPAFSFAKPSAPASSAPQTSSSTAAPSLFSLGSHATTPGTSAPATSAGTSSLFSVGKEQAPTTSAPSTSAQSLFSIGQPAAGKTSQPSGQDASKLGEDKNAPGTNLSSSTVGPPPTASSRLKSRTMDDIITKWATDLSKYQKEFQAQAEKVAQWDRMLVENSEKIQKLYGQTLEAERATTEVERQLSSVEQDQMELEAWLNHYEKEVDAMIKQQGDGELATGPDAERQRTYDLASKLSDRLDEMGKDLTSMIEEINDASSNLGRNKQDDPLSQVVRVLNTHLTQLQQIDQGASALSLKVQEAQKTARRTLPGANGSSGRGLGAPSSEAADGFWKSYMGRR